MGAREFVRRNRRGIGHNDAPGWNIGGIKRRDLRIALGVIIDEVMEIGRLVRIDAAHRLAHGGVEGAIDLRVHLVGGDFGAVVESCADHAAAVLLGQRDIGLGQGRGAHVSAHHGFIARLR